MVKPNSDAPDATEALRSEHERLLSSAQSEGRSLASLPTATITAFLSEAAAAGARILDPRERKSVKNILRFWTAELITRGVTDWTLPQLAAAQLGPAKAEPSKAEPSTAEPSKAEATKPEVTAKDAKTSDQLPASGPAKSTDGDKTSDQELARSRTLVRIAASARQWRASGKNAAPGWLLNGEALDEAEQFAQDDDDIKALVDASRKAESHAMRWKIGALMFLVLVAAIWATAVTWLWWDSTEYAKKLEDARDEQAATLAASIQKLSDANQQIAQRGREQQQQLAALQEAAQLVHRLRDEGKVPAAEIPALLKPLVDALDQAAPTTAAGPGQDFRGYDPAFLQAAPLTRSKSQMPASAAITIPLPKLTGASLETAFDNGRALNALNFSIVLNKARRMAIFSAVNLQRSRIVPIVRVADRFLLDPRVPQDAQLSPASFTNSGLDRGRLASARDIAWGDALPDNPEEAGRLAYGLTSFMTNVTPRYDTFNRGLWVGVERYARELFSPKSDRVVIFTGPVFADDDATVGGIRVPQRFWKVLIATQPDNPASVLVEAYLIAQVDRDGRKIEAGQDFQPASSRVRVSAIERLTGLDFGDVVRAADISSQTLSQPANAATQTGAYLAGALRRAIGPDEAERRAAMQQLLDAVRGQEIAEIDPRTLAEAVVTVAKSFGSLGPEARVNVLTLLAAVPKARWDMERWIDVKAAARRALADAAAILKCPAAAQSCALVTSIKPNLDWPIASGRTVYIRFAGMVRDDVTAIADKLRMLDWSVTGEERTPNAAGYNEVRYSEDEDNRRAAELLAADLRALGRSGVRAKKITARSRALEIWLSI
jgi:DNA/RNA endonuclease G (NUC1)